MRGRGAWRRDIFRHWEFVMAGLVPAIHVFGFGGD
jgi:hypothetical protein